MKKIWNNPQVVKLNVSETAAGKKRANHSEGSHSPGNKSHQTGRLSS